MVRHLSGAHSQLVVELGYLAVLHKFVPDAQAQKFEIGLLVG